MPVKINSLTKKFVAAVHKIKAEGRATEDQEIANNIGIVKSNLSAILTGKRNVPFKYAMTLANHYMIPNMFDEEKTLGLPPTEPRSERPYLMPVVMVDNQLEYPHRFEEHEYIDRLHRYPVLKEIEIRGAEWRWFQLGGRLVWPGLIDGDFALARLIVPYDYEPGKKDSLYFIVKAKTIQIGKLVKVTASELQFVDQRQKSFNVPVGQILELWHLHQTLLDKVAPHMDWVRRK